MNEDQATADQPVQPIRVARAKGSTRTEASAATPVGEGVDRKAEESGTGEVTPIDPDRHDLAEARFASHFCVAQPGTNLEDLHLNANAFSLIAARLTKFDNIRVVAADERAFADLVVVDQGPTYAICELLHIVELPRPRADMENAVPPGYTVRQVRQSDPPGIGGSGRWVVFRDSDGACLSNGTPLFSKADAVAHLCAHAAVRRR